LLGAVAESSYAQMSGLGEFFVVTLFAVASSASGPGKRSRATASTGTVPERGKFS
jgi:hypothetical protein